MTATQVHLLRHGEPVGGNVFRGVTDMALSQHGDWQFRQRVQQCLANIVPTAVVSSPLQRCLSSARWLAAHHQLTCQVDSAWREIDYGEWENRPVAEVLAESGQQAQQLWQDPLNFCAPGGEPVSALQQRVLAAWQQLLSEYRGKVVIVVCHGGVMRILAQALLQLAPQAMNRLAIPYAGWLQFGVVHSKGDDHYPAQDWVSLQAMDGSELNSPQYSAECEVRR